MADRRHFLKALGGAPALGAAWAMAEKADAPAEATPDRAPQSTNALRIALMQAGSHTDDHQANLRRATAFCEEAAAGGADVLLMPEMWSIAYRPFESYDEASVSAWKAKAIDTEGPWVGHFRDLAKRLNMAIAATYLERWPGAPRNTLSLVDRHGEIALTYAKVHTCDFVFEAALTPGDEWPVVELDTAKGPVRVGSMICYDREHPESARSLMLAGAEVILTPNACLLDDLRIQQFRVRAFENATAVAMTNYGAPTLNGRSVAFDGAGAPIVEAGDAEGLVMADIDLAWLRHYRSKTIWGDAWRRPDVYDGLAEPRDLPEFQRNDAFGQPFRPAQG